MSNGDVDIEREKIRIEYGKLKLERWKLLVKAITTIIIPLVIAFAGEMYKDAKETEAFAQVAPAAIDVLRAPTATTSPELRNWAAEVLEKSKAIDLSEGTRQAFQKLRPEKMQPVRIKPD